MVNDSFLGRIAASARHDYALDAFASIIFSPKPQLSFAEMIASSEVPICALYGARAPVLLVFFCIVTRDCLYHDKCLLVL